MNPTTCFYLLLVVLVYIALVLADQSNKFKENGFIFLGNFTDDNDKASAKALSLWCDPNMLTQNDAIDSCKRMGGMLLNIFNQNQDEDVRQFIASLNECSGPFWTSGIFDPFIKKYVWDNANSIEVGYQNFKEQVGCEPIYSEGLGIIVMGVGSQYTWCSSFTNMLASYICKEL